MTPPRLCELECPSCHAKHWVIDSDYTGAALVGREEVSYPERIYRCPVCENARAGFRVLQQSPPAFFLQPYSRNRMNAADFSHWVNILKEHFPDHPMLTR